MSDKTNIEWCDSTWNPWEGCQKVGPGCDHCYAEARNARFGGGTAINWGPGAPRRRTSVANWRKPLAWNAAHAEFFAEHGRRQRVFCASLADVFDNAVDPKWRADLFQLIEKTPHLDWLLLTKRIGNVIDMIDEVTEITHGDGWQSMWTQGVPPENVWLGISVVNQAEADRDIPKLLQIPAAKRFLSMEPLLGSVDLTPMADTTYQRLSEWYGPNGFDPTGSQPRQDRRRGYFPRIDWVIVGGESGHQARPMHPDWARNLRDQCAAAGVPFLFKQWGEWAPHQARAGGDEGGDLRRGHVRYLQGDGREPDGHFRRGDAAVARVGKKAAGRLLDGVQHDGYPEATS